MWVDDSRVGRYAGYFPLSMIQYLSEQVGPCNITDRQIVFFHEK